MQTLEEDKCGTPVTWKELGSRKKKVVAEKKAYRDG